MSLRLSLLFASLLFSGCAGLALSARSSVPIGEVPLGEYDVKAFLALAPTIHADGELTAAVVYTNPAGPRIEVRPTPSIFGILDRPLGRGTGREHLTMVKSMANYKTVAFTNRDGQPIGYAVIHQKGIRLTVHDVGDKAIIFLSTLEFLDYNVLESAGGGAMPN
jgi:hypothetical protein